MPKVKAVKANEQRKYMVTGLVTISVHTDVVASSEEEAIAIAGERPLMSLCHQCAHGDSDEVWSTSGELDGSIEEMEVQDP